MTGTYANDITESEAILPVFGERGRHLPVSSTKPIHGHALGASGGLELAVTIAALREQIVPPAINFRSPDPKCPVDPVPNEARRIGVRAAMSNSFAFGGINAVLVVRGVTRRDQIRRRTRGLRHARACRGHPRQDAPNPRERA